jgi:hypothetical protein
MRTRGLAFVLVLLGICLAVAPARAAETGPRVVVELFTSQGCSDCPAADLILTELAARRDVIALTYPITYWDMLGWKDTLATEANSQRQKAYARIMSRPRLSTPQMIIDGRAHVLGNQRDKVLAEVAARAAQSQLARVTLSPGPDAVSVVIAAGRTASPRDAATVWVMRTLSQARVMVGGGENKDRELVYTNVVRDLQRLGSWEGEAKTFTVPIRADRGRHDGIAVIVQSREHGPVLAAAHAPLR